MKYRWAVLALIMLVLATAIAVNLGLRPVAGYARTVPVPSPPTVGACLIDPLPSSFNVNSSAQGPLPYSQLRMSPCQGARYGEVVSVEQAATPVGSTGIAAAPVEDTDTCVHSTWSYLGLPVRDAAPSPVFTFWYPVVLTGSFLLAPSPRQQAAGQNWLACLVYLPAQAPRTADNGRYNGTMRNAFVTGTERNTISVCPNEEFWYGSTPTACSSPHDTEIFGTNYFSGPEPVSRALLLQTCSQLVEKVTGLTDMTALGLSVQVQATDPSGYPVTGPEISASAFTECGIITSGRRLLSGSLLALGNKPIPWL